MNATKQLYYKRGILLGLSKFSTKMGIINKYYLHPNTFHLDKLANITKNQDIMINYWSSFIDMRDSQSN